MEYLKAAGAILAGIVLLVKAGDRLVHHAAAIAVARGVPKAIVGAVIIGFGTSLPEFFVSLAAALEGQPDIAIANVVGSNIANVGMILGIGALLVSLPVQRSVLRTDLPIGVLATLLLLIWVGPAGAVSRAAGGAMLAGSAVYLALAMRMPRRFRDEAAAVEGEGGGAGGAALWILVGLVGLALGAHLLVYGAVGLARLLDVPERVIGLTVVAFGTSLPELAAMVAAARRREVELAVGNIAGSNLFNLLFILGMTAVIKPIDVAPLMVERDFPAVAVFSVLAFPLLSRERRILRGQGVLLVVAFLAYVAWTWLRKA